MIYLVKTSSEITFSEGVLDNGVRFLKNFIPAGTPIEHSVDKDFNTDVPQQTGSTPTSWGTFAVTNVSGGQAFVTGASNYAAALYINAADYGLVGGDVINIRIVVADINGATVEVWVDNATAAELPLITTNGVHEYLNVTIPVTGRFTIYNVTDGTTAVLNSCSITTGIPSTQDEIATLVSSAGSGTNLPRWDMNWTVDPIAGDTVHFDYDETGDFVDPSGFLSLTQTYTVADRLLDGYIEGTTNAWSEPALASTITNNIVQLDANVTAQLTLDYSVNRLEADLWDVNQFGQTGFEFRVDTVNDSSIRCGNSPLVAPASRLWLIIRINGVDTAITLDTTNGNNETNTKRLIATDDGTTISMWLADEPGVVLTSGVNNLPPPTNTFGLYAGNGGTLNKLDNLFIEAGSEIPLEAQTLKLKNCLNTPNNLGLVLFGSGDPSIVLEESLKVQPSVGTEIGTGVTWNADGMDTNGTGGWYFDLTASQALLDVAGQISITVPSVLIGDYLDRVLGSSGCLGRQPAEWTSNDYVLTWGSDATLSPVNSGRFMITAASAPAIQHDRDAGTPFQNMRCTDQGNLPTKVLTYSWDGTDASLHVDGEAFATAVHGQAIVSGLFNFLHLGTDRGRTAPVEGLSAGQRLTDLVVATKKVSGAAHSYIQTVRAFGDSFATGYAPHNNQSTNQGYDNQLGFKLKGLFMQQGFDTDLNSHGVGGTFVDDTSGGTSMDAQIPLVTADNPDIVIFQGLTNDCNRPSAQFNIVVIESKLKAHLTTILDAGAKRVYVGTVCTLKALFTSDTAEKKQNVADANAMIKTLPAWDARIRVFDLFAATGGENAGADIFMGTWNINDSSLYGLDLHLSSKGRLINAQTVHTAIKADMFP